MMKSDKERQSSPNKNVTFNTAENRTREIICENQYSQDADGETKSKKTTKKKKKTKRKK